MYSKVIFYVLDLEEAMHMLVHAWHLVSQRSLLTSKHHTAMVLSVSCTTNASRFAVHALGAIL